MSGCRRYSAQLWRVVSYSPAYLEKGSQPQRHRHVSWSFLSVLLIAFQIGVFGVVLGHDLVHESSCIWQVIGKQLLQPLIDLSTNQHIFDICGAVEQSDRLGAVLLQDVVLLWG